MRSAGLVSMFTMLSRILGLVRDVVFARLVGLGPYADAFHAAFRIPNLLRDLFAEGALSAAFVPTYTKARAESAERGFELASRALSLLAVILSGLCLLGFLFATPLVGFLAAGFAETPGKLELTVRLTRIMLPFLPLVSFAAVAMGVLNAHGRFDIPALAPSMFNLVAIVWGAVLWALNYGPERVVFGWAVATLAGGLAQFLVQVPALWREGWRFRPRWAPWDPGILAIAKLMAPATVGLAAVQVNIFISTRFASHDESAVAALQYAFRILYLPIGLFGVSVGTVATVGLARRAAAGDTAGLKGTLQHSLCNLAFLTVPATLGLLLLPVPIVRLLFERGRFRPEDTAMTALALLLYGIGLPAYAGVKVLAPAFYAMGSPRIPFLASVSAVAANLVTILALHSQLGFRAIPLGTSVGSLLNAVILLLALKARLGGIGDRSTLRSLAKTAAAALLMAPIVVLSAHGLEAWVGVRGLYAQLVTGLGPVLAGGLVYASAALALGSPEARALAGSVLRRWP
ncbi:MAG TPA: murein biosynthesis integral membrane protein MurJ [Vicinamibacteria bacterium]|nr:murein biosynthesis integral membrane protein MurJ [Vicinamibacteria bacterium]